MISRVTQDFVASMIHVFSWQVVSAVLVEEVKGNRLLDLCLQMSPSHVKHLKRLKKRLLKR